MEYIAFKALLPQPDGTLESPSYRTVWQPAADGTYRVEAHPGDVEDGHGIFAADWATASDYPGQIYAVVPYWPDSPNADFVLGEDGWRAERACVIAGPFAPDPHAQRVNMPKQAAELVLTAYREGYRQIPGILGYVMAVCLDDPLGVVQELQDEPVALERAILSLAGLPPYGHAAKAAEVVLEQIAQGRLFADDPFDGVTRVIPWAARAAGWTPQLLAVLDVLSRHESKSAIVHLFAVAEAAAGPLPKHYAQRILASRAEGHKVPPRVLALAALRVAGSEAGAVPLLADEPEAVASFYASQMPLTSGEMIGSCMSADVAEATLQLERDGHRQEPRVLCCAVRSLPPSVQNWELLYANPDAADLYVECNEKERPPFCALYSTEASLVLSRFPRQHARVLSDVLETLGWTPDNVQRLLDVTPEDEYDTNPLEGPLLELRRRIEYTHAIPALPRETAQLLLDAHRAGRTLTPGALSVLAFGLGWDAELFGYVVSDGDATALCVTNARRVAGKDMPAEIGRMILDQELQGQAQKPEPLAMALRSVESPRAFLNSIGNAPAFPHLADRLLTYVSSDGTAGPLWAALVECLYGANDLRWALYAGAKALRIDCNTPNLRPAARWAALLSPAARERLLAVLASSLGFDPAVRSHWLHALALSPAVFDGSLLRRRNTPPARVHLPAELRGKLLDGAIKHRDVAFVLGAGASWEENDAPIKLASALIESCAAGIGRTWHAPYTLWLRVEDEHAFRLDRYLPCLAWWSSEALSPEVVKGIVRLAMGSYENPREVAGIAQRILATWRARAERGESIPALADLALQPA